MCFLPFSGLKDYSPEELRWEACQAQKQGRVEGYVSGWGEGGDGLCVVLDSVLFSVLESSDEMCGTTGHKSCIDMTM